MCQQTYQEYFEFINCAFSYERICKGGKYWESQEGFFSTHQRVTVVSLRFEFLFGHFLRGKFASRRNIFPVEFYAAYNLHYHSDFDHLGYHRVSEIHPYNT